MSLQSSKSSYQLPSRLVLLLYCTVLLYILLVKACYSMLQLFKLTANLSLDKTK
ncbi:hypothetical protein COCSADRAFT_269584 [Bipolaris sorokiniana ND90Pr]|uniref:Uncharacterized protein n=1 Tax=Cochliobolus sativus (strain ND90Pr / ATCC 201652) TaxID=665912 RepID=M2RNF6_COCSN|nr:uncharacterized protein COCSADRAFT_269584 [Bipolaris sorokiniana ND90Pr]EMD68159.1 hypothetical protein COCSADRAFT_269584 [Bipolaris sorokiniana ND90Pr]